jgi:hypothetical protein
MQLSSLDENLDQDTVVYDEIATFTDRVDILSLWKPNSDKQSTLK